MTLKACLMDLTSPAEPGGSPQDETDASLARWAPSMGQATFLAPAQIPPICAGAKPSHYDQEDTRAPGPWRVHRGFFSYSVGEMSWFPNSREA